MLVLFGIAMIVVVVVALKDVYEKNPYRNYWKMVNKGVDPDIATREALRIYRSNRYGGLENFGRKKVKRITTDMIVVDNMTGEEFERWCGTLLSRTGFENVQYTPVTGDQGVDIVTERDGYRYAVQCKRYTGSVDNSPVQEVLAGKTMYGCDRCIVMTNSHFTDSAKRLAAANRVALWDRERLKERVMALAASNYTPVRQAQPVNGRDEWDDLFDIASMLEDD